MGATSSSTDANSRVVFGNLEAIRCGKFIHIVEKQPTVSPWLVTEKATSKSSSQVTVLAFSPDASTLALGCGDDGVDLIDTSGQQKQRLALNCRWYRPSCVAFSPDGATIATGNRNTLDLWDATTGKQKQSLDHGSKIFSVAYSPDSGTLASGSEGGIILWDTLSREVRKRLRGHTASVFALAFSPDGATMASASEDKTMILWNLLCYTPKLCLTAPNAILSIAFSPDGATVASAGRFESIILWDTKSGAKKLTLTGHTNFVGSVAFSPDGMTVASASADNSVILWDVGNGQKMQTLACSAAAAQSVSFSPEGSTLVAVSDCNTLLWNVASVKKKLTFAGHTHVVTSVAFSPDGVTMASSSADNIIIVWDAASGQTVSVYGPFHCGVTSVMFDAVRGAVLFRDSSQEVRTVQGAVFSPKQLPEPEPSLVTDSSVATLESRIKWLQRDLSSQTTLVAEKESCLFAQKRQLEDREQQLQAQAKQLQDLTREVWDRDMKMEVMVRDLANKERNLAAQASDLAARDMRLQKLTREAADRDKKMEAMVRDLADKDRRLAAQAGELNARDERLGSLTRELVDRDQRLTEQHFTITESKQKIFLLEAKLSSTEVVLPETFAFPADASALKPAKIHSFSRPEGAAPLVAVDVPLSRLPFAQVLWNNGGQKGNGPPRGVRLVRFDALCYPPNHPMMACVKLQGLQMANQKRVGLENRLPEFMNNNFSDLTASQQKPKLDALSYLKTKMVQPYAFQNANCVYTFHGCSPEVVVGIIRGGFVPLHRNDGGYFGAGVYVTTSVEYASLFAFGDSSLGLSPVAPVPAEDPWMPAGCVPVLLCASMIVHAYPLTHNADYDTGVPFSKFYAPKGSPPKALKRGCDAHIIPVASPGFQACDPAQADYWEIVHSKESMVVPMGILWLKK